MCPAPGAMQLESLDLRAVRQANIFCSSPFFLRHALVIISWLKSRGIPVTVWSEKDGPVGPALEALALPEVRLRSWPQLPVSPRVSRPWSLVKTKLSFDRFCKASFQNAKGSLSFYEGDYPEPCLHALIVRCCRQHRVYKYGHGGHDTLPASHVPPPIRFRESLIAFSYGFPVTFFSRQEMPDSQFLPFFDSIRLGVQAIHIEVSDSVIGPMKSPIATIGDRPLLVFLDSAYEEETCVDYADRLGVVLNTLDSLGWQIVAKGHPRLGSSKAMLRRLVPLLDVRLPLELFDLSNVRAVVGLCSSAMLSSASMGIPTYSLEQIIPRSDPQLSKSSIDFLKKAPGWSQSLIHINFPQTHGDLPNPRAFAK